jgi:hypothetical protein
MSRLNKYKEISRLTGGVKLDDYFTMLEEINPFINIVINYFEFPHF